MRLVTNAESWGLAVTAFGLGLMVLGLVLLARSEGAAQFHPPQPGGRVILQE